MMEEPQILYEDNHLFAVNKPADLLTQPSGTDQESVEEWSKIWIKNKYHKPGNVFLHVIHRLDKSVSGVVLFAKTSKALARLQEQSRNHQFNKIYLAWVSPPLIKSHGQLEDWLIHDEHVACVVEPKTEPRAKLCRLSYEVIETTPYYSKVKVTLLTGRYHQIRAQFSASGSPIVGDTKYGSSIRVEKGIALHHSKLSFRHPVTGEHILLVAKPPSLFFGAGLGRNFGHCL